MPIKLDPAVLKKISNLSLIARYVAEGTVSGLHQSPHKGSNLEFVQHRQYAVGDEIKHIDWKVYGRTDRYYIKMFEQETNHRGYCLVDISKSMSYASNGVSKLEYSTYLAAALSYIMIKQRDSAGLISFNDSIREFSYANNSSSQLHALIKKLENLETSGTTDFKSSLLSIGTKIKKRSLLILLSDLLEDSDNLLKTLKFFPYMKNDLIVLHILDPQELNFDFSGSVEFIDLETNKKLKTKPDIIRKAYIDSLKAYIDNIQKNLSSFGIQYQMITTDTPLDKALISLMNRRQRKII